MAKSSTVSAAPEFPRFRPARGLRSGFAQSFLASFKLRRQLNERRCPALSRASEAHELDAGDGVRLSAHFSRHPQARANVVLLHGWEGCHDSVYLHSLACTLFDAGYSVLRFNLRDHGGTHHLNPEPFHSARMEEVFGGLRSAQTLLGGGFDLIGFSLGGNFTLRVALGAPEQGLKLGQAIAVNPVIDPRKTTQALDAQRLYLPYFIGKWRKTVAAKHAAWPQGPNYADLLEDRSLLTVSEKFATRYCGFASLDDYYAHYTLRPDRFAPLAVPTTIISSEDDAIIPVEDIRALEGVSPQLRIELQPHGGHCGYVQDWRLRSWLEPRLLQQLAQRHPQRAPAQAAADRPDTATAAG